MFKHARKLSIHRETLRRLEAIELREAAGGSTVHDTIVRNSLTGDNCVCTSQPTAA